MQRDISIDIAKGLGIILVVFGHTVAGFGGQHELMHKFIYSFHMPFFFAVSGMFISNKYDFISFFKSKTVRFVIPFLFWVLLYFFLYLSLRALKYFFNSFIEINTFEPIIPLEGIKTLFMVPFMANWHAIDSSGVYIDLWFLPAVFSITILFWLLKKSSKYFSDELIFLITIFFSYIVVHVNDIYDIHSSIPWGLDIAIICLPFLYFTKYHRYFQNLHWLFIPILIFIIYFFSKDNVVEVAGVIIESYYQFFITSISGIVLLFLISSKIKTTWVGEIISSLGERTYLIFLMQGVSFLIFKPILSRLAITGNSQLLFDTTIFTVTLIFGYILYPLFMKIKILRLFALGQNR